MDSRPCLNGCIVETTPFLHNFDTILRLEKAEKDLYDKAFKLRLQSYKVAKCALVATFLIESAFSAVSGESGIIRVAICMSSHPPLMGPL
jgi:hypothetical protein